MAGSNGQAAAAG